MGSPSLAMKMQNVARADTLRASGDEAAAADVGDVVASADQAMTFWFDSDHITSNVFDLLLRNSSLRRLVRSRTQNIARSARSAHRAPRRQKPARQLSEESPLQLRRSQGRSTGRLVAARIPGR